jgi:D-glycero-alpha-D-manno-heptose-7-phosphate kinase
VFGGFNFMEFRMDQNVVQPLRINNDVLLELEESLILCDTGTGHDSGAIHVDQKRQMAQADIKDKVRATVELTYRTRNHLLRGQLLQFGQALDEGWRLKKQFSTLISDHRLDGIYEAALTHGAVGGKLLGAGGGGFFLFYVSPFRKHELIAWLEAAGLTMIPFRFEHSGLCAWTTRERKSHAEP